MRSLLTIAAKDIRSSFVTPIAYVAIAGFILLSGFFFFTLLQNFNLISAQAALYKNLNPNLNQFVISPFYETMEIVLIFLVPLLTMRSFAEERSQGTFELLMTSPVSPTALVWGKFLAVSVVCTIMLLLSLVFPGVLVIYSDPEVAPVFVGFLGLVLFALSFAAIGVAISSFTSSQAVAGVVGLVTLLIFYVIKAPADQLTGPLHSFFRYIAPTTHSEMFFKGVIQSSDVVYFLSVILLGLFVANRVVDTQRWR
jgi:ABC-2 type transport system permease protein